MVQSKKIIGGVMVLSSLILGSCGGRQTKTSETVRPNILLLVGDDMGFSDIGPFGSEVNTPQLNTLAEQGIKFTNFHATPVCSVSRSQILTGCNNIEVGLGAFDYTVYPPAEGKKGYEGYLTRNTVTIAELLRDAGYHTYTVGKWHLGGVHGGGHGPHEWGFERSYGIYVGGSNHWNQQVMLPDAKDPETASYISKGKIPPIAEEKFFEDGKSVVRPNGVYSNILYTGKMLEYLKSNELDNKPFFAYVAFTTAHLPIQAPQDKIDKYYSFYLRTGYENLKKKRFEMLKKHGVISYDTPYPDPALNPLLKRWKDLPEHTKKIQARIMATYSAMIEDQDESIGRLIDYLKASGKYDNTLIVYITDNGPEGTDLRGVLSNPLMKAWVEKNYSSNLDDVGKGNTNWQIGMNWANVATGTLQWWKAFVAEGGIRVPMIIKQPKWDTPLRKNEATAKMSSIKDIPITILDYAGVEVPKTMYKDRKIVAPTGVSMRGFLEKKRDYVRSDEEWVAFELFGNMYVMKSNMKARMIRKGMWGDGQWHLYNIEKDPGETTPLEEQYPEMLDELKAIYASYAKQHDIISVEQDWNPWSALGH
ncbi:sulfatase-like hydrolase/transferase [Halosquirtibacter xylanolyticus]|uniref:sulfatase-like hydrolase/transferase n=1 Tax=Halosquirtibacter xylanolyticus TaxID=3374599 RepID=UPI00374A1EE2|nr:sulfatase-like hydrolase/transferase [Prolixibacteraceae bacterium]